jgi:hypothetical protein
MEGGAAYKDLFVDLYHPSLAGQVIVAQNFLCQMAKSELLPGSAAKNWCFNYSKTDIKQLVFGYKQKLNVTREEEGFQELMQSRWHLGMAGMSAYPQDYWQTAQQDIEDFYAKSDKSPEDTATRLMFLGLIEGKRGSPIKTLALVNEAARQCPDFVRKDLISRGLLNGTIADQLKEWGIVYQPRDKKFEMNSEIVKSNKN